MAVSESHEELTRPQRSRLAEIAQGLAFCIFTQFPGRLYTNNQRLRAIGLEQLMEERDQSKTESEGALRGGVRSNTLAGFWGDALKEQLLKATVTLSET